MLSIPSSIHLIIWPSQHHDSNASNRKSNPGPPTSQGSALTPSYLLLAKLQAPQACMHTQASRMLTYSSSTLIGGQKVKFWAEIFMVDARIPSVLTILKNQVFSKKNWNLCTISKVALDFDLDDDVYWI
jgi:hypothetical protein